MSSNAKKKASRKVPTPPFVQIATLPGASETDAGTIFGLDKKGRVWMYEFATYPPDGWLLFSDLCGNPDDV